MFAAAETNFLCSVCYRKQRIAAANNFGGLKCHSPGCQELGLISNYGYCYNCNTTTACPEFIGQNNANQPGTETSPAVLNTPLFQQSYQHRSHIQNPEWDKAQCYEKVKMTHTAMPLQVSILYISYAQWYSCYVLL